MTEETIKKLTTENLEKHKKGQKVLLYVLLLLAALLCYFGISDIQGGKAFEMWNFIMPICALGGAFSVWDVIKKINKELNSRGL